MQKNNKSHCSAVKAGGSERERERERVGERWSGERVCRGAIFGSCMQTPDKSGTRTSRTV